MKTFAKKLPFTLTLLAISPLVLAVDEKFVEELGYYLGLGFLGFVGAFITLKLMKK